MPQIVSKTGAPVIDLGTWVDSTGNQAFQQLMQANNAALKANQIVTDPAFMAMVEQFLAATNQTVV